MADKKEESKILTAWNKWMGVISVAITLSGLIGGFQLMKYKQEQDRAEIRLLKEEQKKILEKINFSQMIEKLEDIETSVEVQNQLIKENKEATGKLQTRVDKAYELLVNISSK